MISAFQHGLRAPEICALRWEQAELAHGPLYVSLIRNGNAMRASAYREERVVA
jgi:integrase